MRIKLEDRVNGEWTDFEALLFNLITKGADKKIPGYFTNRLKVVQAMLNTFDYEISKLEFEWNGQIKDLAKVRQS
jgi:hypothetical protein